MHEYGNMPTIWTKERLRNLVTEHIKPGDTVDTADFVFSLWRNTRLTSDKAIRDEIGKVCERVKGSMDKIQLRKEFYPKDLQT